MSEKSDPEYVPDDAEPWDNRPDAVMDVTHPSLDVALPDGRTLIFSTVRDAVLAAHAILSEVELRLYDGV